MKEVRRKILLSFPVVVLIFANMQRIEFKKDIQHQISADIIRKTTVNLKSNLDTVQSNKLWTI